MPRFPREAAAYAEYVTSPSRQLARTPENLSDIEAAALPLAGLTAWQALVETADVQPGQRVLVIAAAGGVGHLAVQIAKARGAYVIGTASAAQARVPAGDRRRRDDRLHERGRRCDASETSTWCSTSWAATTPDARCRPLRAGGIFIRVPSASDLEQLLELAAGRVRVTGILVEPDRSGLEALASLVDAGELRVHVSQTFPLEDAARAHELCETGHTQGKLVLTV